MLVITNDSSDYTQTDLEQNLIEIGLSPDDAARFIIQAIFVAQLAWWLTHRPTPRQHAASSDKTQTRRGAPPPLQGLQHIPGFSTSEIVDEGVDKWSIVDNNEELRSKIVRTVEDAKAANPNLRAILLESTLLPSFSDSLRQKRGVPVFDAITLADYYAAASTDNPRFGQTRKPEAAQTRWRGCPRRPSQPSAALRTSIRTRPPMRRTSSCVAVTRRPAHRLLVPTRPGRHRPPRPETTSC